MSSDNKIYTQTVLEIVHLIQDGFAYVTGGRDLNGRPIITFPDRNVKAEFTDEEFKQMLGYLSCVPPPEDVELGFVVIIDRRNSSWNRVRSLISRIESFFPAPIVSIFVIGPSSIFQRLISDLKMSLIRSSAKLQANQLVMINAVNELHSYINPTQLIKDFQGCHLYNHDEWIEHRAAVENFAVKENCIASNVRALSQWLARMELPRGVEETRTAVQAQTLKHNELMDDLHASVETGMTLLNGIRTDRGKNEPPMTTLTPDKRIHVICIERALSRLQDVRQRFENFWCDHDAQLKWALRYSEFIQEASEVQFKLDDLINALDALLADTSSDAVNRSLGRLEQLRADLAGSEAARRDAVSKGEALLVDLPPLPDPITSSRTSASGPGPSEWPEMGQEREARCQEVRSLCDSLPTLEQTARVKLDGQAEVLAQLQTAYKQIAECHHWRHKGTLLVGRHSRETNSMQVRREAIAEMKAFLICKPNLKELDKLQEELPLETKTSVEELRDAIARMQSDCERLIERLNAANNAASSAARTGRAARRESDDAAMKCISASCLSDSDAADMINGNSPTDAKIDDSDRRLQTRKHVMRELIETERVYVESLQRIYQVFWTEIDNPANANFVPKELKEDRRSLFGNWEDLLTFHKNVLLKMLESCADQPGEMCRCFQESRDAFEKYSDYCMNKFYADALLTRLGDHHPFLSHCQVLLNHNLPLSAFLLKPVQRVQKYQLLLKEMLKNTPSQSDEARQLEAALNTMLRILRTLNDSMVLCDIVDYPRLSSKNLGRLLLHETFQVSAEQKDTRSVRTKLKQRHVILFENMLLVCKRRLAGKNAEKVEYHAEYQLSMNEIGLTESTKAISDRRFEVWVNNRRLILTLQAPTVEVKQCWTKQLQDLLLAQFERLREKAKMQRDKRMKSTKTGRDTEYQSDEETPVKANNYDFDSRKWSATITPTNSLF